METEQMQSEVHLDTGVQDPTAINLARLLDRLEQTILSPDGASKLRHSPYERNRVGANLEHARSLLLRLEHAAPTSKSSQKSRTQLTTQRRLLKTLQQRLFELSQADDRNQYSSSDEDDEEDLLARYAPARTDTHNSIDTDRSGRGAPLTPAQVQTAAAAAAITSSLRPRKGAQEQASNIGMTSGSDSRLSQSKAPTTTPFAPPAQQQKSSGPDVPTAQLLQNHESEQDALTESLVSMAKALKESTKSFSETLAGSNPLVDAATAALDRNVGGMEAAGQKMSNLRRLTEGVGWWGRMGLYARIGVLWVAVILVTFVLPKLRF